MYVNESRTGYNIINNSTEVTEIVESMLPKALAYMMKLEDDLASTPMDFAEVDLGDNVTEH